MARGGDRTSWPLPANKPRKIPNWKIAVISINFKCSIFILAYRNYITSKSLETMFDSIIEIINITCMLYAWAFYGTFKTFFGFDLPPTRISRLQTLINSLIYQNSESPDRVQLQTPQIILNSQPENVLNIPYSQLMHEEILLRCCTAERDSLKVRNILRFILIL